MAGYAVDRVSLEAKMKQLPKKVNKAIYTSSLEQIDQLLNGDIKVDFQLFSQREIGELEADFGVSVPRLTERLEVALQALQQEAQKAVDKANPLLAARNDRLDKLNELISERSRGTDPKDSNVLWLAKQAQRALSDELKDELSAMQEQKRSDGMKNELEQLEEVAKDGTVDQAVRDLASKKLRSLKRQMEAMTRKFNQSQQEGQVGVEAALVGLEQQMSRANANGDPLQLAEMLANAEVVLGLAQVRGVDTSTVQGFEDLQSHLKSAKATGEELALIARQLQELVMGKQVVSKEVGSIRAEICGLESFIGELGYKIVAADELQSLGTGGSARVRQEFVRLLAERIDELKQLGDERVKGLLVLKDKLESGDASTQQLLSQNLNGIAVTTMEKLTAQKAVLLEELERLAEEEAERQLQELLLQQPQHLDLQLQHEGVARTSKANGLPRVLLLIKVQLQVLAEQQYCKELQYALDKEDPKMMKEVRDYVSRFYRNRVHNPNQQEPDKSLPIVVVSGWFNPPSVASLKAACARLIKVIQNQGALMDEFDEKKIQREIKKLIKQNKHEEAALRILEPRGTHGDLKMVENELRQCATTVLQCFYRRYRCRCNFRDLVRRRVAEVRAQKDQKDKRVIQTKCDEAQTSSSRTPQITPVPILEAAFKQPTITASGLRRHTTLTTPTFEELSTTEEPRAVKVKQQLIQVTEQAQETTAELDQGCQLLGASTMFRGVDVAQLMKEKEDLEELYSALNSSHRKLKMQSAKADGDRQQEKQQDTAQVSDLHQMVESLQSDNDDLTAQLAATDVEVGSLTESLLLAKEGGAEKLAAAVDELHQKLAKKRSSKRALQNEASYSAAHIAQLEAAKAKLEADNKSLENSLEDAQHELQVWSDKLAAEGELRESSTTAILHKTEEDRNKRRALLEAKTHKLELLQEELQKVQDTNGVQKIQIGKLKQLSAAKETRQQEANELAEAYLKARDAEIAALNEEIVALNEKQALVDDDFTLMKQRLIQVTEQASKESEAQREQLGLALKGMQAKLHKANQQGEAAMEQHLAAHERELQELATKMKVRLADDNSKREAQALAYTNERASVFAKQAENPIKVKNLEQKIIALKQKIEKLQNSERFHEDQIASLNAALRKAHAEQDLAIQGRNEQWEDKVKQINSQLTQMSTRLAASKTQGNLERHEQDLERHEQDMERLRSCLSQEIVQANEEHSEELREIEESREDGMREIEEDYKAQIQACRDQLAARAKVEKTLQVEMANMRSSHKSELAQVRTQLAIATSPDAVRSPIYSALSPSPASPQSAVSVESFQAAAQRAGQSAHRIQSLVERGRQAQLRLEQAQTKRRVIQMQGSH